MFNLTPSIVPVHDHAPDADALAPVHLGRRLAVEVDGADGVEGLGLVEDGDAVLLADAEHVEVPPVRGERDVPHDELLPVLVYVLVEPAPLPVTDVVKVGVSVEPGQSEPGRINIFNKFVLIFCKPESLLLRGHGWVSALALVVSVLAVVAAVADLSTNRR